MAESKTTAEATIYRRALVKLARMSIDGRRANLAKNEVAQLVTRALELGDLERKKNP